MRFLMLTFVVALWCTADAAARGRSSWGSGSCDSVESPAASYRWVKASEDPDQFGLFLGTRQVGAYSLSAKLFRPIVGNEWGEPAAPPIAAPKSECTCGGNCRCAPCDPPCVAAPEAQGEVEQNFGVDMSKLAGHGYRRAGHPITREEAIEAIEKGIPDDANKFRLTVIGTDAERAPVEKDWAATDEALKARALLWSVPADHWSVKDLGFAAGKPAVYFTDANGKVLHRQAEYSGAKDLVEAVRKAIADYDAKKDPDLRKTPTPASGGALPLMPCCVGAAALMLLAMSRKK